MQRFGELGTTFSKQFHFSVRWLIAFEWHLQNDHNKAIKQLRSKARQIGHAAGLRHELDAPLVVGFDPSFGDLAVETVDAHLASCFVATNWYIDVWHRHKADLNEATFRKRQRKRSFEHFRCCLIRTVDWVA